MICGVQRKFFFHGSCFRFLRKHHQHEHFSEQSLRMPWKLQNAGTNPRNWNTGFKLLAILFAMYACKFTSMLTCTQGEHKTSQAAVSNHEHLKVRRKRAKRECIDESTMTHYEA
jgi:hypothetical protein